MAASGFHLSTLSVICSSHQSQDYPVYAQKVLRPTRSTSEYFPNAGTFVESQAKRKSD
jgi:hypothetical protein